VFVCVVWSSYRIWGPANHKTRANKGGRALSRTLFTAFPRQQQWLTGKCYLHDAGYPPSSTAPTHTHTQPVLLKGRMTQVYKH